MRAIGLACHWPMGLEAIGPIDFRVYGIVYACH